MFSVPLSEASADPALLRSIMSNLFDNAVECSPEESKIFVSPESGTMGVPLRVANPAGSLEKTDVATLFHSFCAKARPGSSGRHFGLGP